MDHVIDLDGKRLDGRSRWATHELEALKVTELRAIAVGMPYRWESPKADLVTWILRYAAEKS